MAHPDNPKRFVSYTDLRQDIVDKMKAGGDGIKDCNLVNRALKLATLFLPRLPNFPTGVDVIDDIYRLEIDILKRHKEFCNSPPSHPYVR